MSIRIDRSMLEAFVEGMKPKECITVSDWAEHNRWLPGPSGEPIRYRTPITPYLAEIMECLSADSPIQLVILMKGSQIGGTEVGNNWLGYVIDHAPGPFLYVEPTVVAAQKVSKQRIAPMISQSSRLRRKVSDPRSRDSGNTILAKEFPGGSLSMIGANSAVGFRYMSARYLFLDDIDAFPPDAGGEGDPVELAMRRTARYSRDKKIFIVSTPTVKGLSRIEKLFDETDQRYWNVPCPRCGHYQKITWKHMQWPKGKPESVAFECEKCGKRSPESKKPWMLKRGRWVATAKGKENVRGYHINALYSPLGWFSWKEAAEGHYRAKRLGFEARKTWANTVLGETFELPSFSISDDSLAGRREQYPAAVPDRALVLTAGVDVHQDRFEIEVVGWGLGEESWAIDYAQLWGNPQGDQLWAILDAFLSRQYEHETGAVMRVESVCIDSGYLSDQVYAFCKPRLARRIHAVKGKDGEDRPIVSAPSPRRTGRDRRPVPLFTVGTDQAKDMVYSRLAEKNPGHPGYCHFPLLPAFDREYFAQLTSEKQVTEFRRGIKVRRWVKKRERNEALDCRIYAYAALIILNPSWEHLDRNLHPEIGTSAEVEKEEQPKRYVEIVRQHVAARRRRQSFEGDFDLD